MKIPTRLLNLTLLAALTINLITLAGCGGGASGSYFGVGDGGTIVGVVLGNAPGGSSGYTPLADVYVTAERTDGDYLLRSTRSDAYGNFRFTDLPLGTWRFGFSAPGYVTLPAATSWIIGYSETGRTYTIPDVLMDSLASSGDGYVMLSLRDGATGQPVSGATVMVGSATGVTSWSGECTLSVPVRINPSTGQPYSEYILVSASGYNSATASPQWVTPVAYSTVYVNVYIYGAGTIVSGQMRLNQYENFYLSGGYLAGVTITSDVIPASSLNPYINETTGDFSVNVPAGTTNFSLYFSSPYFDTAVVGPITAPAGGVLHLSSPVYLNARRRDVTGYVVDSSANAPSGGGNQVIVEELGIASTPVSGSYAFFSLPVGVLLRISATVWNPTMGRYETGWRDVVVSDGGMGPFNVPTIYTN